MLILGLAVICAIMVIGLTYGLRKLFPGVSARVWPWVLVICAAVAVWWGVRSIGTASRSDIVSTTCEVRAPSVRTAGDAERVELVAKLRWQVGGKTYTTFKPMVIDSARSSKQAELEERYRDGTRIDCYYVAAKPNAISPMAADTRLTELWWGGIGLSVGAALLLGAALRMRREASQLVTFSSGSDGPIGLVLVAAVVAAMIIKGIAGTVLGVGAAIAFIVLVVYETMGSDRAFRRMRDKLDAARYWPKPPYPSSEGGWDPYAEDRVTGTYRGRRVWMALHVGGATVEAELEHWPSGLSLQRRTDPEAQRTGDPSFDEHVQIDGSDELWRPILSSAVREQLGLLFRSYVTAPVVASRRITLDMGAVEAMLQESLDAVASLDVPAVSDPEARVFELAADEPVAAVRFGHYRWLVECGWNAPLVYRAAAADRDNEIAAWGRQHVPADAGAFR